MRQIPLQPSDITPEWLSAALGLSAATHAAVRSIRAERVQSLTSTMHRLHVSYSRSQDALPGTLIWKQSSVDPAVRAAYGHYRGSAYEREVSFYVEIAPTISARVPRCYLAEYDAATDEHVLLLEDLSSTHVAGDVVSALSPDHATLCLRELALLHAPHWGKAASLDPSRVRESHGYFVESLRACRDFLVDIVGTRTFGSLSSSPDVFAAWSSQLHAGPRTVIHADVHAGNVLFPVAGSGRAVLVDWQGWREGPPARDLGRGVVLMLTADERRSFQRQLVSDYCAVLREHGVSYDEREAFADYRLAATNQWIWAVTFARRRDRWDDATREAMPELIRRAAQAALEVLAEAAR